jgi:hypothetical protein
MGYLSFIEWKVLVDNAMLGIWRKWRNPMTETLESVLASLPVQQQEAIVQQTKQLIAEEMTLRELRKARARSLPRPPASEDYTVSRTGGQAVSQRKFSRVLTIIDQQ